MNRPLLDRFGALGARDRRALRLGVALLGPALFVMLVLQPYRHAARATADALATERSALARELAALRDAPRDARLVEQGTQALAEEGSRLFEGADAVAASAELASWVGDRAAEAGLELEDSETRATADSATVAAVEIRGAGDVLAIVAFLEMLESEAKLARVERLTIGPPPGADEGDGTLVLSATITSRARRASTMTTSTASMRGLP